MEFMKFIIVGGVAVLIQYLFYLFFNGLNFNYNSSYTLGYVISFLFNFLASNLYTFNTKPTVNKGIKFILSHLCNYTIQILLLNFLIFLNFSKGISPILVYSITIPTNFIFVRLSLKGGK